MIVPSFVKSASPIIIPLVSVKPFDLNVFVPLNATDPLLSTELAISLATENSQSVKVTSDEEPQFIPVMVEPRTLTFSKLIVASNVSLICPPKVSPSHTWKALSPSTVKFLILISNFSPPSSADSLYIEK